MNILDKICQSTKERVERQKREISLTLAREMAQNLRRENAGAFLRAVSKKGEINFICEVKKASPSKGLIAQNFEPVKIAKDYETAGAAAISCLTEPEYFLGADEYLQKIKKSVSLPVLRKDFIVDEYMIFEAKNIGADAILLIAAVLDDAQLGAYFSLASELGLDVLFEAHDEAEAERILRLSPKILGVNNRNLKTFEVDLNTSVRLRKIVPDEVIFVAESGIKTHDDVRILQDCGTNAVLVGESLMRQQNRAAALLSLKGKM